MREYYKRQPKYYIRMCKNGRWFFLWKLVYNKHAKVMRPIWWDETLRGDSKPYLYRTLTGARNSIDRYEVQGANFTVGVWEQKKEENDVRLEAS